MTTYNNVTEESCHLIESCNIVVGGHRPRGSEDIIFFCHLNSCDLVINRLCDFVNNSPSLEATVLSSLEAISLVEVFQFSRDHLTT